MSGWAGLRAPQKPGDELQELVEKAAEKPVGESARNGGDGNHGNVVAVERRARTAAPHVFGLDPATHRPPPFEPRP